MREILFAGFGGQGVLTAGLIVSQIALYAGNNATWMPSYGAAMRGGTANCTVHYGEDRVYNPGQQKPDLLLAMNTPSFKKFSGMVRKGGIILYNSDMMAEEVTPIDGVTLVPVPCNQIADSLGNPKGANIVMIGAIVKLLGDFEYENGLMGMNDMFQKKGRQNLKKRTAQPSKRDMKEFKMIEKKSQNPLKIRWLYLVVCAIGLLFMGILYAWSIMKIPLAEAFGWNNQQLTLNYTIMMCAFCLGSVAGGFLSKKKSVKFSLFLSAAMILAGYLITAGLGKDGLLLLYLFYGGGIGCGIGMGYNTILAIGNSWFPDMKGTSSGLMMMCFGFSTMVLGKLAEKLFQTEGFGWRKTYCMFGIAITVVLLLCAVILRRPDKDIIFPVAKKKKTGSQNVEVQECTSLEMMKSPSFWIYYVYGILNAAVGSAVISFASDVSLSLGATVALAATLVGVLSICNGLGRVLCGITFDRIGCKPTMILAGVVTIVAPILMLVALWNGSLLLAAVSFCMTGISYGCNPTISSAFVSTYYGMKNFPENYSISNTKLLISSFAATAASSLYGVTGSYVVPFAMLLFMSLISFGLIFGIRNP